MTVGTAMAFPPPPRMGPFERMANLSGTRPDRGHDGGGAVMAKDHTDAVGGCRGGVHRKHAAGFVEARGRASGRDRHTEIPRGGLAAVRVDC
jgi:hypothetical protein